MSVVKDRYRLHEINTVEIDYAKNEDAQEGGRVSVSTARTGNLLRRGMEAQSYCPYCQRAEYAQEMGPHAWLHVG